jgi:hypothetical protein
VVAESGSVVFAATKWLWMFKNVLQCVYASAATCYLHFLNKLPMETVVISH